MKKFDIVAPGQRLRAADVNRAFQEVGRLGQVTVGQGLELLSSGSGIHLRLTDQEFFAQLTDRAAPTSSSSSSGGGCCAQHAYAWREVEFTGSGNIRVKANGRNGTTGKNPAYHTNGVCVEIGSVVRMYPGWQGEYEFTECCSYCQTVTSSSSSSRSSSRFSSSGSAVSGSSSSVSGESGSSLSLSSSASGLSLSSSSSAESQSQSSQSGASSGSGQSGSSSSGSLVSGSSSLSGSSGATGSSSGSPSPSPSGTSGGSSSSCSSTTGTLCVEIVKDVRCENNRIVVDKQWLYIPASAGAILYTCPCPSSSGAA